MQDKGCFQLITDDKIEQNESAPGHSHHLGTLNALFEQKGRAGDKSDTFRFMSSLYTKPVIKRDPGKWYIEYYYRNPFYKKVKGAREFERIKVYERINWLSGDDQEEYAKELRNAVEVNLAGGYDPFDKKLSLIKKYQRTFVEEQENKASTAAGENIITLLDLFYAAKIVDGLTQKSLEGYQTPINHFKKWLAVKGWTNRGVKLFTENNIIEFLKYMQHEKSWVGKTYNTNREYAFMWFNWFELEHYIDKSPLTKRIKKQKEVSVKNEYYHGRIREIIQKELQKFPDIKLVCEFVYYSCVRSYMELSQITVGDVDLENRVIKIKESVGKTGYRFVPICDELADLMKIFNLQHQPLNFYLFGKGGKMNTERLYKNHYSTAYKKVRDNVGLGKEYTIYSWKHTRMVDLKNAGYSDAEIQDLSGHTSGDSYDTYQRSFGMSLNTKLRGKTMPF